MIWSFLIWYGCGNYAQLITLVGLIPKLSLNVKKLYPQQHTWNFFRFWSTRSQLMPRIMTMNGDHQTVATAPLDLRTRTRERGSDGSRTPDCRSPPRDELVTGGSPAPPASTGTDSLEVNCPTIRNAPSSETSAAHKRSADKPSNTLPFRKRRITVEPETQIQSPAPTENGHRFSPAEQSTDYTSREILPGRLERVAVESRVGVAPRTPRLIEEPQQTPECSMCFRRVNYGKLCIHCFNITGLFFIYFYFISIKFSTHGFM